MLQDARDQVFFNEGGVLVTRNRLTSPTKTTFQMRNVAKVEMGKESNEQFKLGVYTILAGAVIALVGFLIGDVGGILVALFGLAMIGGIVNWRRRFFSPFFVVVITTSSQPEPFVRTQDAEFAVRVQNAINDAWASAL